MESPTSYNFSTPSKIGITCKSLKMKFIAVSLENYMWKWDEKKTIIDIFVYNTDKFSG